MPSGGSPLPTLLDSHATLTKRTTTVSLDPCLIVLTRQWVCDAC